MKARRTLDALLVIGVVAVVFVGCTRSPRVIVLGFDGMDPRTVDLLMSEGKLPNFARLRSGGAYGRLRSSEPMLSPILWTTIATGKQPTDHGIGHFVAVDSKTGGQVPVTSDLRRAKALWNVFSDMGRSVATVGWWATFPAEKVNGAVVSDRTCYHFLLEEGTPTKGFELGTFYPEELATELAPLVVRPDEMTAERIARFVDVPAAEVAKPFDFADDISHFKWVLANAESYRQIGLRLWRESRPDLLLVYVEGTDSTAHLFGHLFRAENLAGELAEQQRRYGRAVEEIYRYADEILGQYLAVLDSRTTLVVLSDHGFELGALQDDPSKTRDMRRVSERFHAIEGILYLYGNGVRARSLLERPTILDVAPTVLALGGIPPGHDMPGRVLVEGLHAIDPLRIATHETGAGAVAEAAPHPGSDAAMLEHLKSLGYVGGATASASGERNLAAMLFEQGRVAEAADAYRKLVAADPENGALRTSFAGALGALGNFDAALAELEEAIRLEPLNPEAYHNRGAISERRGDVAGAVREYRTALRYRPQYEPSRQALVRLTGSAETKVKWSEGEKRAIERAEEGAKLARRGDYAGAMAALDSAEKLAPKLALVQQYRSNVAYLNGDRRTAITALEKALVLEPDNALFRENLKRLREPGATSPTRNPGRR